MIELFTTATGVASILTRPQFNTLMLSMGFDDAENYVTKLKRGFVMSVPGGFVRWVF